MTVSQNPDAETLNVYKPGCVPKAHGGLPTRTLSTTAIRLLSATRTAGYYLTASTRTSERVIEVMCAPVCALRTDSICRIGSSYTCTQGPTLLSAVSSHDTSRTASIAARWSLIVLSSLHSCSYGVPEAHTRCSGSMWYCTVRSTASVSSRFAADQSNLSNVTKSNNVYPPPK